MRGRSHNVLELRRMLPRRRSAGRAAWSDSCRWIARLLLATALGVGLAGPLRSGVAAAPAVRASDDALAARLGGTRASFAAAFGTPVVENVVNGSRYDVAGFGLVLAQFRQTGGKGKLEPTDRATIVTLRSPRPEETAATAPDDHDWTLDQAIQVVTRFLPADVALSGPATAEAAEQDATARQGIERSCRSDALAAAFPDDPAPGACQIAFLMPTPVTVSYVTLILGAVDEGAGTTDRCDGMRAWGQATGARMQSALATLGEIAAIADGDPTAAAQLRTLAARFMELSAAQSGDPTPRAAQTASEQLVAAFDGFATAIAAAATGLEQNDQAGLAQAVSDLDSARSLFDAANALVLSVLQRCDLTG